MCGDVIKWLLVGNLWEAASGIYTIWIAHISPLFLTCKGLCIQHLLGLTIWPQVSTLPKLARNRTQSIISINLYFKNAHRKGRISFIWSTFAKEFSQWHPIPNSHMRWHVTHLQQHCGSAGLKSVGDAKCMTLLKIRLFLRIFFFLGKVLLSRFEQSTFQMSYRVMELFGLEKTSKIRSNHCQPYH